MQFPASRNLKFVRVTGGFDGCLWMLDMEGWQELGDKLAGSVIANKALRSLRRRFLGHSEVVEPDKTNRIRIPDPLAHYAGLGDGKDVVVVGAGRIIEIWSRSRLDKALADPDSSEEEFFESLLVEPPAATSEE